MIALQVVPPSAWARAGEISHFFVDLAILGGAIAAVVKFQLFHILSHRWHSTVECAHHELPDGSIIFTADYYVTNTGQRPLEVTGVSLRVLNARRNGALLVPDEESPALAERNLLSTDLRTRGNFRIEPGERTIFPIRCHFDSMPDSLFVACTFKPKSSRPSTIFRGFYCRHPYGRPQADAPRVSRPIANP